MVPTIAAASITGLDGRKVGVAAPDALGAGGAYASESQDLEEVRSHMTDEERKREAAEEFVEDLEAPEETQSDVAGGRGPARDCDDNASKTGGCTGNASAIFISGG